MTLEVLKAQNISNLEKAEAVKQQAAADSSSIFTSEVKPEGVGDQVNTSNGQRTIDQVYQKISEICVEYRMSIEDVKKAQLLENIAGCSSEDLVKLSDNELNEVITALKKALTRDWKVFWKNRDLEDIKEIAKDANAQLVRQRTGGSWLGQKWHNLVSSDESITKFLENIDSLPKEEKIKKYAEALKKFGYTINQKGTPEEKALLSTIIEKLKAADRALAAKVLITSCGNNAEAQATVAESVEEQREAIVSKEDALGETPTVEDSTEIANTTFKKMNEEGVRKALERQDKRAGEIIAEYKALLAKKEQGTLTEEEAKRLSELETLRENYVKAGYSGALTAIPSNENLNPEKVDELVCKICGDTHKHDIYEEVLENVKNYLEKHPEASKLPQDDLIELITKNNNTVQQESKPQTELRTQSEAKTPDAVKETQTQETKEPAIGFITPAIKAEPQKAQQLFTQIVSEQKNEQEVVNNSKKEEKQAQKKSAIKQFEEYISENGTYEAVTKVFTNWNKITHNGIKLQATRIFESFSDERQADILRTVSNSGLAELIKHTSDNALRSLKGETLTNYYATKLVNDAAKEVEEKRA